MLFDFRNIFILFTFIYSIDSLHQCFIKVSILDGPILGRKLKSDNGTTYFAFQDIPYAKAPVGKLRLQEPIPIEKWTEVLNTTENKRICHQNSDDPRQTEDCLVLNVYTPLNPKRAKDRSLSVLVWIHGGIFLTGHGGRDAFGPDYFIDQDIVVVTMNYRYGPLGFLSTGDSIIPGNIGLKDQHLALKWVQRNIGIFGGDSTKVTIMGQSFGATSAGYHLMSKKSKGLFRAAIMQSSSPLSCASLQKYPKYAAYQLGSRLDKNFKETKSSKQLLSLLQSVSVEEIKKHSAFKMPSDKKNCQKPSSSTWAPIKENENCKTALVTGMNHENIKNGNINKIPILLGINSQEVLTFGIVGLEELGVTYDKDITLLIVGNLNIKDKNKVKAARKIKEIYTNGKMEDDVVAVIEYGSDSLFNTPMARHAYLQSKHTDVYFYQFSHNGPLGQMDLTYKGAEGVGHAEELKYLFRDSTNANLNEYPKEDVITHRRVVDLWTQFIKYMNPTKYPSECIDNISWPKVTQDNFVYLDINSNLTVAVDPKKYKEYSKIYAKYAEDKLDTY